MECEELQVELLSRTSQARKAFDLAAQSLKQAFGSVPSREVIAEFCQSFDILVKTPVEDFDAIELARRIKIERVVQFVDSQSHEGQLPPPPEPSVFAKDVASMSETFGGVYFAWEYGICVYVGRSKNIPSRIRTHHVVKPEMELSWLEFDEYGQHWNELYYIGLLRPDLNFGGKKTLWTV
jgi:hypothetical protein